VGKSKIISCLIMFSLCKHCKHIGIICQDKLAACFVLTTQTNVALTRGMCPKGGGAREDTRVNEAYGGQIVLTITLLSFTRCKSTRGRGHTPLGPPSFAIPVACKVRLDG
jgi:hypothetical protein